VQEQEYHCVSKKGETNKAFDRHTIFKNFTPPPQKKKSPTYYNNIHNIIFYINLKKIRLTLKSLPYLHLQCCGDTNFHFKMKSPFSIVNYLVANFFENLYV